MKCYQFPCIILVVLVVLSCNHSKPTREIPREMKKQVQWGIEAVVTTDYLNDGCEVLLRIMEDSNSIYLMPINLDDSFKVDGSILRIEYHSSKIAQVLCQMGRPVVMDRVVKLK